MKRLSLLLNGSWSAYCRDWAHLPLARSPKCGDGGSSKWWTTALGGAGVRPTRRASNAELLVHQACHLGTVGAAPGLAHDVPDDRSDGLGVAFAHALGGVLVGGKRGGDDAGELVAAVERGEPLGLDDRERVAAV